MNSMTYEIAGISVLIEIPVSAPMGRALSSFNAFKVTDFVRRWPDVSFSISNDRPGQCHSEAFVLGCEPTRWGLFELRESGDFYSILATERNGRQKWIMQSSKDFKNNVIFTDQDNDPDSLIATSLIMLGFGQAALKYSVIMFHASALEGFGSGFAFLGKSGTGKSTHTALWEDHLSGFSRLNDDSPAIGIDSDGQAWIYGTPWSGKTVCYRNVKVPLKALVRLSQNDTNYYLPKDDKEAFITVLPSVTALRWNNNLYSSMISTLRNILDSIAVGHLYCLPNEEAVRVCRQGIADQLLKQKHAL